MGVLVLVGVLVGEGPPGVGVLVLVGVGASQVMEV